MKRTILIWSICSVLLVALIFNQNAGAAEKKPVKASSGKQVIDISGEWDAIVENLGAYSRYGTYPQTYKITQKGSSFTGIRMKDDPGRMYLKAGEKFMGGEVDENGVKKIELFDDVGSRIPAVCKISEAGKKINIDAFDSVLPTHSQLVRVTMIKK
jgi:hypothetical protein